MGFNYDRICPRPDLIDPELKQKGLEKTVAALEEEGNGGVTVVVLVREGRRIERRRKKKGEKMNKKEIFKLAKGFRGRAKNCIRIARERVEKALQYSYRDRRNKKREMRGLWIERINAGSRQHGVRFSPEFLPDSLLNALIR